MDASQDIAAYEASRCNRVAATVLFYAEQMCDAPAWTFDAEAHELGLDPWREVQGVDYTADKAKFWLDYASGTSRPLTPMHRVFVQIKDLPKP